MLQGNSEGHLLDVGPRDELWKAWPSGGTNKNRVVVGRRDYWSLDNICCVDGLLKHCQEVKVVNFAAVML